MPYTYLPSSITQDYPAYWSEALAGPCGEHHETRQKWSSFSPSIHFYQPIPADHLRLAHHMCTKLLPFTNQSSESKLSLTDFVISISSLRLHNCASMVERDILMMRRLEMPFEADAEASGVSCWKDDGWTPMVCNVPYGRVAISKCF